MQQSGNSGRGAVPVAKLQVSSLYLIGEPVALVHGCSGVEVFLLCSMSMTVVAERSGHTRSISSRTNTLVMQGS